ncbi:unnamed protein product [Fraxinus pennsylvanica]|uniref:SAM domain-containing protein n=1 Tax=Fraxinus pennsylvanica TaxID=56036 RepID=A0AAD1Z3K7_9LAMI|nr:unnamed protein product [Fraxinus pennsylvanica]
MATEIPAPDGLNSSDPPTTAATFPDPPPIEHPTTTNTTSATNAANINPGPSLAPKRQRRPSVRLGEIGGDPTYDTNNHHIRRPNKTWRFHKDPSLAAKTSKTRPLTNLVNVADSNYRDAFEHTENYASAGDFIHRKPKNKKPMKRARTNWNKFDSILNNGVGGSGGGGVVDSANAFQAENENNNGEIRDFEPEGSDSPLLKEPSPVNSVENMGLQFWDRQRRESNGITQNEVDSQDQRNEASKGVREWLIGLGLGRYAPVFEIHEVDNEVLPMLTLEDLKDMGINAVGSRRKIYSAILKLQKGLL